MNKIDSYFENDTNNIMSKMKPVYGTESILNCATIEYCGRKYLLGHAQPTACGRGGTPLCRSAVAGALQEGARDEGRGRAAQGDAGMSAPKFAESRLAQVLLAPIVSEKATQVAEKHNQVLFKVLRDATKPEIKAAVELLFKVEVEAVSVVNVKGKVKRFGRSIGRRDHVKKAYVALKAGQELNFSGEAA